MSTKDEGSYSAESQSLNMMIHGHRVTLHFSDTPNTGLADLVKRALLDAYMPMVKQMS